MHRTPVQIIGRAIGGGACGAALGALFGFALNWGAEYTEWLVNYTGGAIVLFLLFEGFLRLKLQQPR